MKIINNTMGSKSIYVAPDISCIHLDNEISLILSSQETPPEFGNEGMQAMQQNNNLHTFRDQMV